MAHVGDIHAIIGSTHPNWGCWAIDVEGDTIDYSAGSFPTVKIRQPVDGTDVVTSGLTATGGAGTGDGSDNDDSPSLIVSRASSITLGALERGPAELIVIHSTGRVHKFPMIIEG